MVKANEVYDMISANRENLRVYARSLLGNRYSEGREKELIEVCLRGNDYYSVIEGNVHHSHIEYRHMCDIDMALGTNGVETVIPNDGHPIIYCNMGDPYYNTIVYYNGRLLIGPWGFLVESTCLGEVH